MQKHTLQHSQVQVMSGSHSEIKYAKTTVSWHWRTLVKVMMPCSVRLTSWIVAKLLMLVVTGSFPMELEFSALVTNRISTEPEVRWWYFCNVEEVEWMESTAVRYLIQWRLPRPYTLERTQQVMVSNTRLVWYTLALFNYCHAAVDWIGGLDWWTDSKIIFTHCNETHFCVNLCGNRGMV